MSTFNGNVIEFPDIQIDYFRRDPGRPAAAFFLSHVHSDHLRGLESFKGSFIYCSPATREILLRLEKYPHRMNFARGILEARVQSYKHVKSLLKPIPLETPTTIEISPGRSIRVTLFDANHCVGAVMFLIEGDGKAILYTGDIRSEAWWVDALARNPIVLPFIHRDGRTALRRLDAVYLDTTFATKADKYREFPSKASGISELLQEVSRYQEGTKFYMNSWTFGYEEVWVALASYLKTQVHVDDYRYQLYRALADTIDAQGRPTQSFQLIGTTCGNHYQEGCLTTNQTSLHSCERGTGCPIWEQDFVHITPIVSRYRGSDVVEAGAGGGQGDLKQQHTLEIGDAVAMQRLMDLCSTQLREAPHLLSEVTKMLESTKRDPSRNLELEVTNPLKDSDSQSAALVVPEEAPIAEVIPALVGNIQGTDSAALPIRATTDTRLSCHITFPYSRHSSYHELCHLLSILRPIDIHPCTVDEKAWDWTHSMSALFGHLYDEGHIFRHDGTMQEQRSTKRRQSTSPDGQTTPRSSPSSNDGSPIHTTSTTSNKTRNPPIAPHESDLLHPELAQQPSKRHTGGGHARTPPSVQRGSPPEHRSDSASARVIDSRIGERSERLLRESARGRIALRQDAYDSALGNGSFWFDVGLISVQGHQEKEVEL